MKQIKSNLFNLFFVLLFLFSPKLFSQSNGSIDPTFVVGTGFNNVVRASAIQPDGKVIVAGDFTSYKGTPVNRIARLNTNGTLDATFSIGAGFNRSVNTICLQPDGKIIIAGVFTTFNGKSINRIVRVNSNGSIDNTFSYGSGFNNSVNTIVLQNDGKILFGGDFTSYNGATRNRIIRLNSNGIIDNNFSIGTGFNSTVNSIAIQSEGKIIAVGNFTKYSNTSKNRIVRINSNGQLDNSLSTGTGFNNEVIDVAIQTDGKLIVGGSFTSYNGSSINRLVRLSSNGSLDNTFATGKGLNNTARVIEIQPNGAILVGGNFTKYNNSTWNRIVRLLQDGSPDANFFIGTGFSGVVRSVSLQSNGWAIVGGSFASYNGVSANNIVKINAFVCPASVSITPTPSNTICTGTTVVFSASPVNGGINPSYQWYLNNNPVGTNSTSFSSSSFNNGDQVKVILTSNATCASNAQVQSNTVSMNVMTSISPLITISSNPGKSACSGTYVTFNATASNQGQNPQFQWFINGSKVGTNSSSFSSGTLNSNDQVYAELNSDAICAQPKAVTSNTLKLSILPSLLPIVTLATDKTSICQGSLATFIANVNNAGANPTYNFSVNGKVVQNGLSNKFTSSSLNDGDIVSCMLTNAVPGNQGGIDPTFSLGSGLNSYVRTSAIQPDGKVILAGDFSSYNGSAKARIVRLNVNGSIDNSFIIGSGFNRTVSALAIQEDGKIIVGGNFTTYNGVNTGRIIRLNQDGSIDNSFNTGSGFNNNLWSIAIQNDGKILVGGDFKTYNGVSKNSIIRLNSDGSIDNNFNIGGGFNNTIYSIVVLYDGSIVAAGNFTSYNGAVRNRIIKLASNGSIDNTFSSGVGFSNIVYALAVQADGKILAGGMFTSYNGSAANRIARLNINGSADNVFNSGTGFNNTVRTIAVQSNDLILAGGDFTTYSGNSKNRVIRLNPDGSVDNNINIGTGFNNSVYTLSIQSDGLIIANGDFTSYNGSIATRAIRLQNALCFSTTAFSEDITMKVIPNTVSAVSISAIPGNVICSGKEVVFTATSVNAGTNPVYQWFLNNNLVSTNTNVYQNSNLTTNDQVYAKVVSTELCSTPDQVNSNVVTITANTDCGNDPETQSSLVQTTVNQTKSMDISWNVGYWDNRVVFIKQSNNPEVAQPVNGVTYLANSTFGLGSQIGTTGWYCVYNGTGNSLKVSGLRPNTNYQTMVLEYHGNPGSEIYNVSSTTNNPASLVTLGVVQEDFNALKAIYEALNGSGWSSNWDTLNNNVSNKNPWLGVTVGSYDPANGIDLEDRITQITISGNNLMGSLPSEIGNLSELTYLSLPKNNITGSIPKEIGNLTKLTYLNLNNNGLSGIIPVELGNLTNLTNLHLAYNDLTGEIPSEIGNLVNLVELVLSNNQLTGGIPTELSNLNNLTRLGLPNNQLTGIIPTELGNLSSLTRLILSFNKLTGSIPVELGQLTNLTSLGLTDNGLTGEIPVELGNLINLTELNLYSNQLTGEIPKEIGKLVNLTTLNLSNNNLLGDIPNQVINLTKLKKLNLSNNSFTSIPNVNNINFEMAKGSGLQLNNNKFTFNTLGNIKSRFYNASQYNPQKPFDLTTTTFTYLSGENVTIDVNQLVINNLGTGNTFTLVKDNKTTKGNSTSGVFTLNNIALTDTGTYYLQVTNSQLSGLTLVSVPFKIELINGQKYGSYDQLDNDNAISASLFPNPTQGQFKVKIKNDFNGDINIKIINSVGQVVSSNQLTKSIVDQEFELEINENPGLYFVEISIGDKKETLKILKR